MEVIRVEAVKAFIPFDEPFVIASGALTHEENFFLKVTTSEGIVGWGQGTPWKPATGDSFVEVVQEVKNLSLKNIPAITTPSEFFSSFTQELSCHSLQCAFDLAIHDIVAKKLRKPVYELYSSAPRFLPNSVTVSLYDTPEETAVHARTLLEKYPELQLLKIKLKGEGDLERCRAIHKVCPPGLHYILDANEGFSDQHAGVEVLNQIVAELGAVQIIEEPSRKGNLDALRYFKEHIKGTLIAADESCGTPDDVIKLIEAQAVHGVNIKLQKCGGITPARQIAALCREASLSVMVGCMIEYGAGISAGVHFAASSPEVLFTDLDGDLSAPCISQEQIAFLQGKRIVSNTPGLGYDPVEALVQEAVAGEKMTWETFCIL